MNAQRVSSQDVANEAGVSRATVSYVFNPSNRYGVSDETRAKVLEVAARLGYAPSVSARSLRGKRDLVLCFLPDWPIGTSTSTLLSSLSQQLQDVGLTFLIRYLAPGAQNFAELWRSLTPAGIISFIEFGEDLTDRARHENVPLIMAAFERLHADPAHVDIPEQRTARTQAEHLHSRGRKYLAFAFPDDDRLGAFSQPRLEGVRAFADEHGLPEVPTVIVPLEPEPAAKAIETLLTSHPQTDGICCYNDEVAAATSIALQSLGKRVPVDVAVIGVDDDPIAQLVSPALSTVRIDTATVAQGIVESLRAAIAGEAHRREPMDASSVRLIVRDST
ncbi:LacI family DNA-binding transcriptional regulator [Arthrobacter sp. KNU-44]|uniref:LacI family DNA-binding transcriptional regulator n=1 Tax=Arthrobacter sp. KNU-44 TaxID=3450744 RepID=UPI003F41C65A